MTPVRVGDLTSPAIRLIGDPEITVTGVGLDSRTVVAGDLYAGMPGSNAHGASFASGAIASGAGAVLTDEAGAVMVREAEAEAEGDADVPDVPILVTQDPRAVLGEVSARVYGRPAGRVRSVGITGTNGKTTTAYLLDGALRALGEKTGLVGTIETRVGDRRVPSTRTTPESCDLHGLLAVMVEEGVGTATMEVSSHALVLHRVDGIVYDVACFTNLSQDHLDFHHTMQDYAAAKAELFTPERARRGVVCVDDDWGRSVADGAGIPVSTVANSPDRGADWVISSEPGESAFVLTAADGSAELDLRSPLPGDFNRTNTAVAALALLALGYPAADVQRALEAPTTVPGRAERIDLGPDAPLVILDFAHTPDAVSSVLGALRPGAREPLVAVLGAGGGRDPGKRAGMGRAAAEQADLVVVTDDNPRHEDPATIRAAVLAGARTCIDTGQAHATDVTEMDGRELAIESALRLAGPGGTVAVLGKGHEDGQEIRGTIHPYDDRSAVSRAWRRIREGAS
ncbi:UDP-N-acetylmuramoyl-L-alanyl-D-glutamate--2,6-diaminopimelate ligase [Mobilicoccus caccae]|uniref:UDP-N-acetylmuramoyl-L-alanyl-D-glutamate--2,6-diaminopimelate ligase n=1 Tax=Mobilicoccus caccae TaxID=1859295 RepID=A0ABQ6ITK2_9MICO|nr:UDP-N-acetylmuramoyl-L-alanyl-D-glutamate--2,6-diaminopimelate ligase [Mobilicoccus caccae]GMA40049.1 UDP-N-acetylmuramoyl-L-alanyl-D-glutamate--2,6-diaminopimelate ligase [Mobilicoccus caccae]